MIENDRNLWGWWRNIKFDPKATVPNLKKKTWLDEGRVECGV